MSGKESVTFVAAVNNQEILRRNLLASPCLQKPHPHQILVQEGFVSAARAYNDAIGRSDNDLLVFVHQDMVFPADWFLQLRLALASLEETDPGWGVLGCYGATLERGWGYVYSFDIHGGPFDRPVPVQTLDEIVLILRKSSGLRFDEEIPHFHFYGADICLEAARRGLMSYAISAFCVHNAQQNLVLPKEFYDCYWAFKRKWTNYLPVQTTCIRVTKFDIPLYKRKLTEVYLRHIVRRPVGVKRLENVNNILQKCQNPTCRGEDATQRGSQPAHD